MLPLLPGLGLLTLQNHELIQNEKHELLQEGAVHLGAKEDSNDINGGEDSK